jgi:hypothetical protein
MFAELVKRHEVQLGRFDLDCKPTQRMDMADFRVYPRDQRQTQDEWDPATYHRPGVLQDKGIRRASNASMNGIVQMLKVEEHYI